MFHKTVASPASSLPTDGEKMQSRDKLRSKYSDKMSARKQKISEKEDEVINIDIHDNSPDSVNTDSVTEKSLNEDLIDLAGFDEIEYQTNFSPLHPTENSNKIKYVKSKNLPKEMKEKAFKNLVVIKDDDQCTYKKFRKQLGTQFILIGKDAKEEVRIYATQEHISADIPKVSEMDQEDSVDQEDSIINEGVNLIKAELTGIDPKNFKDHEMVYIRNNDSVTYKSRSETGDRLILIGQDQEQNGSIYVIQKKTFDLPKEYVEDMDDVKNVLKQEVFSSFRKVESEFKGLKQEIKIEESKVKNENIEEWRELKEEKMEIPIEENAPCSATDESSQYLEILYQSRTEDGSTSCSPTNDSSQDLEILYKSRTEDPGSSSCSPTDDSIQDLEILYQSRTEDPGSSSCSPTDDSTQDLEILYQSRTEDPSSSNTLHSLISQGLVVQPKPGAKVIMGKDAIYVLHVTTPNPNYTHKKLVPRLLKKKEEKTEKKKDEKVKKTEKKKDEKDKKTEKKDEKNKLKKKALKTESLKKNTKR